MPGGSPSQCQTVMYAQPNEMHSRHANALHVLTSSWQPRTVPVSVSLRLLYQAAMAYRYCTCVGDATHLDSAWRMKHLEAQSADGRWEALTSHATQSQCRLWQLAYMSMASLAQWTGRRQRWGPALWLLLLTFMGLPSK